MAKSSELQTCVASVLWWEWLGADGTARMLCTILAAASMQAMLGPFPRGQLHGPGERLHSTMLCPSDMRVFMLWNLSDHLHRKKPDFVIGQPRCLALALPDQAKPDHGTQQQDLKLQKPAWGLQQILRRYLELGGGP